MNKKNLEKFFEELEKIRDFHPSSPEFAKLLSKYDLPFSTREAIKILKKIS
jgi:F0F1-type ATP synthase delta subunit